MNNEQYIAALKRELKDMKRPSRDEIVREIQSHIEESGSETSLLERFGSPAELASRYLEDEPPQSAASGRTARVGKNIFFGIGVGFVSIVALAAIAIAILSGDKFDYADKDAPELNRDTSDWTSTDWSDPVRMEVSQGQAVIYWHDNNRVQWNCNGRTDLQHSGDGTFKVRHGFCLIFLPTQASIIELNQGGAVLIRPKAPTKVDATQSNVRIARNGGQYRYRIDAQSSDVEEFISSESADVSIDIVALESTIEKYVYD